MDTCKHPATRLYAWITEKTILTDDDDSIMPAPDGSGYYVADMMHIGCYECGKVLPSKIMKKYIAVHN
jgi:hypothetical protein